MKAILILPGNLPEYQPLGDQMPLPIMPLCGKPLVFHQVEIARSLGATEIHFLVSHLPHLVEEALGEGGRWGATFLFHLVRPEEQASRRVEIIARDWDEPFLIANGQTLVSLEKAPEETCLIGDPQGKWSGWMIARGGDLKALKPWLDTPLGASLDSCNLSTKNVDLCLNFGNWTSYQYANNPEFLSQVRHVTLPGQRVEDGVWLSRNVVLHPTAKVLPPVHIGENVRIEKNATVGPYAAIGSDCIISAGAKAEKAVIWKETYVGEDLDVIDAIVDGSAMVNLRVGTTVTLQDPFLLGSLRQAPGASPVRRVGEAVVAVMGLLALGPFALAASAILAWERRGNPFTWKTAIAQPTLSDPRSWREFTYPTFATDGGSRLAGFLRRSRFKLYPTLVSMLTGQFAIVGLKPRTREELSNLDREHLEAVVKGRIGLLTITDVEPLPDDGPEMRKAQDLYYLGKVSIPTDVEIVLRWMLRIARGDFKGV